MTNITFVVVVTRLEHNIRVVYRTRKFKSVKNFVKIQGRSFIVDWTKPLYVKGFRRVYVVDFDTCKQVVNQESDKPFISPAELDTIVGTHVIREITHAVTQNTMEKVLWAVIGGVIGALAAALIVMFVMQDKIDNLTPNIFPIGGGLMQTTFKFGMDGSFDGFLFRLTIVGVLLVVVGFIAYLLHKTRYHAIELIEVD